MSMKRGNPVKMQQIRGLALRQRDVRYRLRTPGLPCTAIDARGESALRMKLRVAALSRRRASARSVTTVH